MDFRPSFWMLAFLFLPLERFVKLPVAGGTVWNGVHLLFAAGLIYLYATHFWGGEKDLSGIPLALLTSLILFFSFMLGAPSLHSFQALAVLLLAVWSGPLLYSFCREYPRIAGYLLIFSLAIQAVWGTLQFSYQRDLNLQPIGETALHIGDAGIATFRVPGGAKLIRGYGPYPHSNPFGGSMVVGLLILSIVGLAKKKILNPPFFIASYFIILALGISFSRAAWLGAGLIPFVARTTTTKVVRALPVFITILMLAPLFTARAPSTHEPALTERVSGLTYAGALLQSLPVWRGVGPGNYALALNHYLAQKNISHEPWEITPVHNVAVLALIEWGVIPTLLIVAILIYRYRSLVHRRGLYLLPIIPLLVSDHYFLTELAPLVYLLLLVILLGLQFEEEPAQKIASVSPPSIRPLPQ